MLILIVPPKPRAGRAERALVSSSVRDGDELEGTEYDGAEDKDDELDEEANDKDEAEDGKVTVCETDEVRVEGAGFEVEGRAATDA